MSKSVDTTTRYYPEEGLWKVLVDGVIVGRGPTIDTACKDAEATVKLYSKDPRFGKSPFNFLVKPDVP